MRILGIDPGLASTGFGVIAEAAGSWRLVDSGEVRTASTAPLGRRLAAIHDLVAGAVREHRPDAVAVESLFFAKNVRSAVLMAHGRGAAVLAAAQAGAEVFEYSPLEIKQSVLGSGRATKEQVAQMVKVLLGLAAAPASEHQADALACALAHAFRSRLARAVDGSEVAPALAMRRRRRRTKR